MDSPNEPILDEIVTQLEHIKILVENVQIKITELN